jgi:hypothetical protein
MDLSYISPILGVIVGWILSELSLFARGARSQRQRLGRALTGLLVMRDRMSLLYTTAEHFKDSMESWDDFNHMREHLNDRALDGWQKNKDLRESTIDIVSEYDPLQAVKLKTLFDSYEFSLQTTLSTTLTTSREAYIMMLSAYEVTLKLSIDEIEKAIRNTARRRGIFPWMMFLCQKKKQDKFARINRKFVYEFSTKLQSILMNKGERSGELD